MNGFAPNPDAIQRTLDDILARPEFAPASPSILDRIFQWIGDFFEAVFSIFSPTKDGGNFFSILILTLLAGALVFLVVLLVRRYRKRNRTLSAPSGPSPTSDNAETLLSHAELLAHRGLIGDALSYLFMALLKTLEEKQVLVLREGCTNSQYLRELRRARYADLPRLEPFFGRFNGWRYGGETAALEDYNTWKTTLFEGMRL